MMVSVCASMCERVIKPVGNRLKFASSTTLAIGKDSSFKAHKDAPRGTYVFGSLMMVGLWVSLLRRGSSESLPVALTRPRNLAVLPIFWMYPDGAHAVPYCRYVEALDHGRWVW